MKTSEKLSKFVERFTSNTHGSVGECHCGIFHLDVANKWDDDHLEVILPNAKLAAKEFPDRYQFHDTAIDYLNFNGHFYVRGCRCRMDDFMFDFLNEEKENVLKYYMGIKDRINVENI